MIINKIMKIVAKINLFNASKPALFYLIEI